MVRHDSCTALHPPSPVLLLPFFPPVSSMRTSRIARDTSKVVAASTRNRPLRLTRAATNTLNAVDAGAVATAGSRESEAALRHGAAHSGSDLSSLSDHALSDGGEAIGNRMKKRKRAITVKCEVDEIETAAVASPTKESKPRKARRVPAKKITAKDGTGTLAP